MVTAPRYIVPGQLYLLTRRCSERRYFLKPDPLTTSMFLYALAAAAERSGIRVIAWLQMSNHYHAIVEDPHGNLPVFLCFFHKMAARSLNTRWGRSENFWSADPASVVRLVELADALDKTIYSLVNPVAADLVESLEEWPGACSFDALDGAPIDVLRPTTFYRPDGTMPEVVQLRAEAPTSWPGGVDAWAAAVRAGVEARVQALGKQRRKDGRRVVGRQAVLTAHHTDCPKTVEPRCGLRPELACLDPARRVIELDALRTFREVYAVARSAFIAGMRKLFPWGTYKFVRELGAPGMPAPA